MTGLIDALAAVSAMCLFCTAAFLVILLTDDGELEERPTEADRMDALHAEIERLRRHNTRQSIRIYQLIDQRDVLLEEIDALNADGRSLDPRDLVPWRTDN